MSIEAMKQALEALRNAEVVYMEQLNAMYALQQAIEFQEMVAKGTKAWANTPDDWVDDLRGGAEIVPSDYPNSHQPVAWREIMGKWKTHYYDYNEDGRGEPLYTAPPKREWVGLRDEELPEGETYDFDRGVRWAETKLKERNT